MGKGHRDYKDRTDKERREIQSRRIVEILRVHRLSGGGDVSVEKARSIAASIGRSERTVWRHLKALRLAYEALGSSLLDG